MATTRRGLLTITFRSARQASTCEHRYTAFRRAMRERGVTDDTTQIPLATALETIGLADTLWALGAMPPEQQDRARKLAATFGCDVAEHVLWHFERRCPGDPRVRNCIAVTRRFLAGHASLDELRRAEAGAWNAEAGARSAEAGAWNAEAAARSAMSAARSARSAARSARSAAWSAEDAEAGAWNAEAGAWNAEAAARSARSAALGARSAEKQWQIARLRELLEGAE